MRRFIGTILALAMLLGVLLPPAFATEAEAPAAAPDAATQKTPEAEAAERKDFAEEDWDDDWDNEAWDDDGWYDADDDWDEEELAQWLAEWEAEWAAARAQKIRDLGGTPGQINLRLNERMVAFPDAAPQLQNGRMMVPVRALMEALGAEVLWLEEEEKVILEGEGFLFEFTLGSENASYRENGAEHTLTLDAPVYQTEGRCYVPLRLIGETLGYEIYWDEAYQTAVLLARASIIADIDAKFAGYNGYLAANALDLQSRTKITEQLALTVEVLDSLQGNRSFAFPAGMELQLGDGGLSLEGTLDLSQLGSLLRFAGILEEGSAELEDLAVLIGKHSFACKLTPEGMLYFHMPLLDLLFGYLKQDADAAALWYQLDLNRLYPEWRSFLEMETMGELAFAIGMLSAEYSDPIDYYDDIQQAIAFYSLLEDGNLKRSGREYRLQMDLDKLIALLLRAGNYDEDMAAWMEADMRDVLELFELDLRFSTSGSYQSALRMKLSYNNSCDYQDTILQAELSGKGTPKSGEQSGLLQMKNRFNLYLEQSFRREAVQTAPDFALPEGSKLLDLLDEGAAADPFDEFLSQTLPKLTAQLP